MATLWLKQHIAVMSRILPQRIEREDIPEYPWYSIRELIINAVCHRDYEEHGSKIIVKIFEDRLEFYNTGGFPSWITPENIVMEQYSRNPTIARALSKVRYIEELGEGWDKIIYGHKKHLLKPRPPDIKEDGHSVLVTLFSTKEKFEKKEKSTLTQRQKEITAFLGKNKQITTGECASLLGVSSDTALRELSKLKSLGVITKKSTGRGTYYIIK